MDRFEAAFLAILLLAAVLRFYGLSERPLHSDESAHAHFTFDAQAGRYTYDPIYHGPFLFHMTAISFSLFGVSPFALRLPQVLFGIGLIALLWPLRKEGYLGKTGVLVSALLLAVSPAFVYYSRFAIHDSFFAFFTLGTVVFSALYIDNKKSRPVYLYLASAMFGLLFTVKENAYVTAAIFAVSALATLGRLPAKTDLPKTRHLVWAALVFVFVFSLFYSSYFRNFNSLVIGATGPLKTWFDKVDSWTGHQKPAFYYVSLFVIYELPTMVFGLAGAARSLAIGRKNRFLTFISLWALLNAVVYFFIKYKTPWLIVHMALPFALLAGSFLSRNRGRPVTGAFVLLLAFSAIAMARVTFEEPSSPREPLIYVQTSADVTSLVRIVDGIAGTKRDNKPTISVISTDYWPLPFYFRNYSAGYWTGDVPGQIESDIVLVSTANEKKVAETLGESYRNVGIFKLREWYGAGYTPDKLYRFLIDGSGYNSTGSFDLTLYVKKNAV